MTIRVANTDFDRVDYDGEADVVYLAAERPVSRRRLRRDAGGHAARYGRNGEMVGPLSGYALRFVADSVKPGDAGHGGAG